MDKKGYTLWELMMTLAIASILTLLAVQNFATPSPHRQLKEAAQTLRGHLQLARHKAIAKGKPVTMTFTPKHSYSPPDMEQQALPSHIQFGLPSTVKGPPDTTLYLDGVGFASFTTDDKENNTVTFQPNGVMTNGSISLNNSKEAILFKINQAGRITLFKWNGQDWKEM